MKKSKILLFGLLYTVSFAGGANLFADEVQCSVEKDSVKIIKCTYVSERMDHERVIEFEWHSERVPYDDRKRSIVLPARHGSLYDFRYLEGRAEGKWRVSARVRDLNGSEEVTESSFTLRGGSLYD